jgi:E3 ubiquitin-protein ligase RNF144
MQSIKNAQKASLPVSATSLPTSPVSKPVTIKSTPNPPNFFAFRWFFRGSRKSSSKKKSKQLINKNGETFVSLTDTTKILSRQSYSFDDIQQFLINNTEQKAINSYKSNLEIAIKTDGNKKKCLTYFTCKLCLTEKSSFEMHSIWSCGCAFCKPCLSQYCEMSINEGKISLLSCPDGSCPLYQTKNNLLSPREIKLLVSQELYETYERFRLNWIIENDPNRTWCPSPNCETICYIKTNQKNGNKPLPVYCSTCNKTFCSSCRRNWHLGIDCKKFSAHEDVLLSEMSPIKRCPKCCILIERDEGCAQIMCRNCKHVFCWFCLTSLEDDFLLRHYDSGPCKHKLGHSRASVIWHRTQVVGIFAGFGLLILLASPMFILAAPCLLCCKCNSWYKNDDHEDYDDFNPVSSDIVTKSDSIL